MIFVQIAAIIVSFLITLYVGKRWQFWFKFQLTGIGSVFYWITLFLVGFSLVLSRLLGDLSSYWIPLIGSIIFGIFICAFYILIIFDILYLISFKNSDQTSPTKLSILSAQSHSSSTVMIKQLIQKLLNIR
ncbi:hypothetical protein PT276_06785 [Orbaceae bacterium ESL0721]|nr:hypothetical protein [Orbaceae bacterium ESL0721]MDF7670900.1 hypothetical protein [Orbaceae bacterium ESL0721]